MDAPKTLSSERERALRLGLLSQPHVEKLTTLVHRMRQLKGPEYGIPYFDPMDGGTQALVLFLLEAPGPKAVASGFVSRNNPDETAKNFFLLNEEASIDRRETVTWNAVPWYIGDGSKIRPAKRSDVREADDWLRQLLQLLTRLRYVVFVGKKAMHAREVVSAFSTGLTVLEMPHPSPMYINRAPANRGLALASLRALSRKLSGVDA